MVKVGFPAIQRAAALILTGDYSTDNSAHRIAAARYFHFSKLRYGSKSFFTPLSASA